MSDLNTKTDKRNNPCGNFKRVVYEVPSHRNEVKNISEIAIKTVEKEGVETDFHQLELVLLEAMTNGLLYGNLEVPSKVRDTEGEDVFWQLVDEREKDSNFSSRKIVLEIDCSGEELEFKIRDEGGGFDWRNYLKSIDTGPDERFHDRGILLIQNYVDQLRWNDRGNEMTFVLKLGPKAIDRR